MKCNCGNEVDENECWDPGARIKLFEGKGLKFCKKCWLNEFSTKRVVLIKEYIDSLNIKYTPPTYKIIKTITEIKEFEVGQHYLLGGKKTLVYYAGFYRKDHWFVPLDLSEGYIIDGFNNFENDTQPKIPNEYLPPKELMDFVCSRPSFHLLPELIKMTMAMKDNSYQLIELTSGWSNNFGNVLQTGTPKPFTFKEKTLLEELELTEGDLNNTDIKKVVTDLENWENKETYSEALRITKELAKLYKER